MKKPSSKRPAAGKSSSKASTAKPSLLQVIVNALGDLKAQNIVTLDVARLTDVTDTLIIASGSSNRQVRALAQHAVEEAKKQGMPSMGVEGMDSGEWVLADFGDAVLHVMQPEIREFYDLEKLWRSNETPTEPTKEPVKKTASKTTADKKSTAKKSAPVVEAEYVTQSDAAKARKAPGKPKVAPSAVGRKKPAAKTAPPKAGVLAKTGTKKPIVSKKVSEKTTVKKATAKKVSAPKTTAKPIAPKLTTKKPATAKPAAKKPAARKPGAK